MAGKRDKIKDKDRFSIMTPYLDRCYICGSSRDVAIHEVFGGSNRAKSKEYGLCIPLCMEHHNGSSIGVHFNKQLDDRLKQWAEKVWIDNYCEKDLSKDDKIYEFIKVFGKNFLD